MTDIDAVARFGTLSPQGAVALRRVRQFFLDNPSRCCLDAYECGAAYCIAGYLGVVLGDAWRAVSFNDTRWLDRMVRALGFVPPPAPTGFGVFVAEHPVGQLFDNSRAGTHAIEAVERIEAFLQRYGYPVEESVGGLTCV